MTYNALDWLLSLVPLLAVLGLMIGRRWNASRAGAVGWLLALALAAARFGAGTDALAYAQLKALILTLDVAIIIWAALVLYSIAERAGALIVIARSLSSLTADRTMQVLLLGWAFAAFLQGVGGFGVPVAIVAPLLAGLGVPRVKAVVIPALGHGWAVTFGSLAASFIMLSSATGLPGDKLAPAAALMLGALCYGMGFMVAHALAGWRGVARSVPYVLAVGTAMAGAQYALAVSGLWSVAAIGGGLAGLLGSVLWFGWLQRAPRVRAAAPPSNGARGLPSVRLALAGYAVLVLLAVLLRGVAPIKDFLDQWAVGVDIPGSTTARGWEVAAERDAGFGIPAHPGVVILYACAIAYGLFWRARLYPPGAGRAILRESSVRAGQAALGVFMMVSIASTMGRAGMIEIVAQGLSGAVPRGLYAFVAPLIGALGAFVTGSNVNSNAVFGLLQRTTAENLALPVMTILAAQTAAAAVISVMSPAKVTVGCSTVGASEGEVMRWLLGYGAVVVLLVGALAWIGIEVL